MNLPLFQDDRSEHLRRQLVQLPSEARTESGTTRTETARTSRPQWKRRAVRISLTAAAACLGLLGTAQTSVSIQSAYAAGVLNSVADQVSSFSDLQPGPDEYLLISAHANWGWSTTRGESGMNVQTIDVYIPGDPDEAWVLDRDWGVISPGPEREVIHAEKGEFYGGPWGGAWTAEEIEALPRDGQALYDHFNGTYQGGSASRDENNFVRMTDLLRTGLVPADLRAGFYEALALIPGVTATENIANFDGQNGIAIGRTEPLRAGQRQEIIIDPNTGFVIGERTVSTYPAFGLGDNNVAGHTAIDYRIVDSAPER